MKDVVVRRIAADEARARAGELAEILIDCVEGGASVSFMAPLSFEKARAFWLDVTVGVANNDRILLVAEDENAELVGTVQVVFAWPENQPHRADVAKMLVRGRARRRGIGAALMRAAEDAAREAGKVVLVLDTITGSDAERLYERLGWVRVGVIPDYALWPDGRLCQTTYFYRHLTSAG